MRVPVTDDPFGPSRRNVVESSVDAFILWLNRTETVVLRETLVAPAAGDVLTIVGGAAPAW
jgi:hypothetical protein